MSILIKNGICNICGDTKIEITKPNHLLHLILTILSGGIWVIIWFLLSIESKPKCSKCGRKAKSRFWQ